MATTEAEAAAHLRERAEDVRREAKSIQRRVRVLGSLAAKAEEAAEDYIAITEVPSRPTVK